MPVWGEGMKDEIEKLKFCNIGDEITDGWLLEANKRIDAAFALGKAEMLKEVKKIVNEVLKEIRQKYDLFAMNEATTDSFIMIKQRLESLNIARGGRNENRRYGKNKT